MRSKPCLEALEDRFMLAVNTFTGLHGNGVWEDAANWSQSWYPGQGLHTIDDIVMDGNNQSGSVTLSSNAVCNSVTFENGWGWNFNIGTQFTTGKLTLNTGNLDCTGLTGAINFIRTDSLLKVSGGNASLGPFQFGGTRGTFEMANGGTLTTYGSGVTTANWKIDVDCIWDARQLTTGGIRFAGGAFPFIDGQSNDSSLYATLWTSRENGTWLSGGADGAVLINNGWMIYTGTSTTGVDTIQDMPLQNNGKFYVDAGASSNNAYKVTGSSMLTSSVSILNTGSVNNASFTSGIFLANGPYLKVDTGFKQTGGEFRTVDTTAAALTAVGGSISFTGGHIRENEPLTGSASGYGWLTLDGNVSIVDTTMDFKIQGNDVAKEDFVNITGLLTTSGSTLAVHPVGTWTGGPTGDRHWALIDTGFINCPTFANLTVDNWNGSKSQVSWDGTKGMGVTLGTFFG